MCCQGDDHEGLLVQRVCELYEKISSLESLKPSKHVDTLFTQLVLTCMPPTPIDVSKLCKRVQETRSKLIRLCGEAEGHLETHFSTLLGSYENPLHHLNIFPYYSNYLKLSKLEHTILSQHLSHVPSKIAFVGSGPLPLTSIVLASDHLTTTTFHNFDIDPCANSMALALISSHPDLSKRMVFHTTDIMDVTTALKEYEVIFLAALVGMDKLEKLQIIQHLAHHMAPGAILMLRSAHGARAFLYPVVDPIDDLRGFQLLSVFHPTDEVINSVVIARKYELMSGAAVHSSPSSSSSSSSSLDQQGINVGPNNPIILLPNKCCEVEAFNPLNHGNNMMIEELAFEEQLS